mmetsp:Transcript_100359/g.323457  ORF Transcript_100359/g.323457 Transcript_100359/m.323457 type:complete len:115 (+) Transcript_100359:152-496(+)
MSGLQPRSSNAMSQGIANSHDFYTRNEAIFIPHASPIELAECFMTRWLVHLIQVHSYSPQKWSKQTDELMPNLCLVFLVCIVLLLRLEGLGSCNYGINYDSTSSKTPRKASRLF